MNSGDGGFGMNVPGASGMEEQKDNASKWYTRWYVWVFPVLVVVGLLVATFTK